MTDVPTIAPRRRPSGWGRRLVILVPALWLILFFVVPCLIVLKISLSQTVIAQPPYTPLLDLSEGWQGLRDFVAALSVESYKLLGSDTLYITSYLRSLLIAGVSTALLLLIGYPIAYGIARACHAQGHQWTAWQLVLPDGRGASQVRTCSHCGLEQEA